MDDQWISRFATGWQPPLPSAAALTPSASVAPQQAPPLAALPPPAGPLPSAVVVPSKVLPPGNTSQEPAMLNFRNSGYGKPGRAAVDNSFLALASGSQFSCLHDYSQLLNPRVDTSASANGCTAYQRENRAQDDSYGFAPPFVISGYHSSNSKTTTNQIGSFPYLISQMHSQFLDQSFVVHGVPSVDNPHYRLNHYESGRCELQQQSEPGKAAQYTGHGFNDGFPHIAASQPTRQSSLHDQWATEKPIEAKTTTPAHSFSYNRQRLRVFCQKTVGEIFVNDKGFLSVICLCHNWCMSVTQFCQHSGSPPFNPGVIVHLENGEPLAHWRRLLFLSAGIRVPADDCGWDWPDCVASSVGHGCLVGWKDSTKHSSLVNQNCQKNEPSVIHASYPDNLVSRRSSYPVHMEHGSLAKLFKQVPLDASKDTASAGNSFLWSLNNSSQISFCSPPNNNVTLKVQENHGHDGLVMPKNDMLSGQQTSAFRVIPQRDTTKTEILKNSSQVSFCSPPNNSVMLKVQENYGRDGIVIPKSDMFTGQQISEFQKVSQRDTIKKENNAVYANYMSFTTSGHILSNSKGNLSGHVSASAMDCSTSNFDLNLGQPSKKKHNDTISVFGCTLAQPISVLSHSVKPQYMQGFIPLNCDISGTVEETEKRHTLDNLTSNRHSSQHLPGKSYIMHPTSSQEFSGDRHDGSSISLFLSHLNTYGESNTSQDTDNFCSTQNSKTKPSNAGTSPGLNCTTLSENVTGDANSALQIRVSDMPIHIDERNGVNVSADRYKTKSIFATKDTSDGRTPVCHSSYHDQDLSQASNQVHKCPSRFCEKTDGKSNQPRKSSSIDKFDSQHPFLYRSVLPTTTAVNGCTAGLSPLIKNSFKMNSVYVSDQTSPKFNFNISQYMTDENMASLALKKLIELSKKKLSSSRDKAPQPSCPSMEFMVQMSRKDESVILDKSSVDHGIQHPKCHSCCCNRCFCSSTKNASFWPAAHTLKYIEPEQHCITCHSNVINANEHLRFCMTSRNGCGSICHECHKEKISNTVTGTCRCLDIHNVQNELHSRYCWQAFPKCFADCCLSEKNNILKATEVCKAQVLPSPSLSGEGLQRDDNINAVDEPQGPRQQGVDGYMSGMWRDIPTTIKDRGKSINDPVEQEKASTNIVAFHNAILATRTVLTCPEISTVKERQVLNARSSLDSSAAAGAELSVQADTRKYSVLGPIQGSPQRDILDEESGIRKCKLSGECRLFGEEHSHQTGKETVAARGHLDSVNESCSIPDESSDAPSLTNSLRLRMPGYYYSGSATSMASNSNNPLQSIQMPTRTKRAKKWKKLDVSNLDSGLSEVQYDSLQSSEESDQYSLSCGKGGSLRECVVGIQQEPSSFNTTSKYKRKLSFTKDSLENDVFGEGDLSITAHRRNESEVQHDSLQSSEESDQYSLSCGKGGSLRECVVGIQQEPSSFNTTSKYKRKLSFTKDSLENDVFGEGDLSITAHRRNEAALLDKRKTVACPSDSRNEKVHSSDKNPHCLLVNSFEDFSCQKSHKVREKPVVCGEYGIISNKYQTDGPMTAKIYSISSILKYAKKCSVPDVGKDGQKHGNCAIKKTHLRSGERMDATISLGKLANNTNLIPMPLTEHDQCDGRSKFIPEPPRAKLVRNCRTMNGSNSSVQLEYNDPNIKSAHNMGTKYSLDDICKKGIRSNLEFLEAKHTKKEEEFSGNDYKVYIKGHEHKPSILNSDAFCCVCGSPDKDDVNRLMECSNCLIRVHQACYGVLKVPKGQWYCRPCRTNVRNIACVLCGYGGGAMTRAVKSQNIVKSLLKIWAVDSGSKHRNIVSSSGNMQDLSRSQCSVSKIFDSVDKSTSSQSPAALLEIIDNHDHNNDIREPNRSSEHYLHNNSITAGVLDPSVMQWVHMVCGLWTPGTRCPNVDTMSTFDVSGALKPRKSIICSICNRAGGTCIKCRVVKCVAQFHPWCAHQKGLLQSEVEGVDNENVGFYGRCAVHATVVKYSTDTNFMETDHTPGRKDFSCARAKVYTGWKREGMCVNRPMNCHVRSILPQELIDAWVRIKAHRATSVGMVKPSISLQYDCQKEYLRYKQEKGWRRLVVYKSGIHGLGLYTSCFILHGTMVVEYVGEIVGPRVADKRESEYQSGAKIQCKSACYFFRIDKDNIIDATRKGGIARFVNHSCLPNCVAKVISVRDEKKVIFFADRDIYPGEEITYDYHFNHEDEGVLYAKKIFERDINDFCPSNSKKSRI